MSGIVLYCRPGFEGECASEAASQLSPESAGGHIRAIPGAAQVQLFYPEMPQARHAHEQSWWGGWIFARQWFVQTDTVSGLAVDDRAMPLARALATAQQRVSSLFFETPDREDTKVLAPLCRALEKPVVSELKKIGGWDEQSLWRGHVCMTGSTDALVGISRVDNSASWPGGIPRLKFPREAPSRSTLKLEEALMTFLTERERKNLLQPGMRAVDLGAAPGGWTWQLVRRHIHVIAVDNGAMDAKLLDSGLVEHVRADGFRFQPDAPVDWLVCDMVEQPIRIARLVAQWFAQGWCRRAIFNLKLPMKKRYAEVQRCLGEVENAVSAAGKRARVRCKQLYHDREEVTAYLEPQ